jgi:septal ring factor EnvC (AmiA/AmiB activator)
MAYITNLPINGVFSVTAYFGQENKEIWKNGHKGIDVVGETTIYSVCDGVVTYQGYDDSWGYYVSVMPNGFDRIRFILCHLVKGSIKVKKGDKVTRKTVLGMMGTTGNSTGVHTHIECRIDNVAVDPTPYLKIENKKASKLNSEDYKTTVEESNQIMAKMIDDFDEKNGNKVDYKALYTQEKEKSDKYKKQVASLEREVKELKKKISNAKNALE